MVLDQCNLSSILSCLNQQITLELGYSGNNKLSRLYVRPASAFPGIFQNSWHAHVYSVRHLTA